MWCFALVSVYRGWTTEFVCSQMAHQGEPWECMHSTGSMCVCVSIFAFGIVFTFYIGMLFLERKDTVFNFTNSLVLKKLCQLNSKEKLLTCLV